MISSNFAISEVNGGHVEKEDRDNQFRLIMRINQGEVQINRYVEYGIEESVVSFDILK